MYCINCGVELADSETRCPLCGTVVFHPELERPSGEKPFPPDTRSPEEPVSRAGLLFVLTSFFSLALVITLLCDWRINGGITWSGYAACAILTCYVVFVLPLWFHSPNPVIFVPADFAVVSAYLLYIDLKTGGRWFLPFAFPVVGGLGLIVTAVIALRRYVRRGRFFVYGGAMVALGVFMPVMEYLLNLTFAIRHKLIWSIYPLAVFVLFGAMLLVAASCRSLRESLHKKFFL